MRGGGCSIISQNAEGKEGKGREGKGKAIRERLGARLDRGSLALFCS